MFSAKFRNTLFRSPTRDVLFTSLAIQYYVFIDFIHCRASLALFSPSRPTEVAQSPKAIFEFVLLTYMELELVSETIFWNCFFFSVKYLPAINHVSFVILALSNFNPIYFNLLLCLSDNLMISLFLRDKCFSYRSTKHIPVHRSISCHESYFMIWYWSIPRCPQIN